MITEIEVILVLRTKEIQQLVMIFFLVWFWSSSNSKHFFQGAKTGKDNGYTMLFDIESFDYSYYDEGSEGLKVALVHHLDMPIMRQTGFHIAPGTENQVSGGSSLHHTSIYPLLTSLTWRKASLQSRVLASWLKTIVFEAVCPFLQLPPVWGRRGWN